MALFASCCGGNCLILGYTRSLPHRLCHRTQYTRQRLDRDCFQRNRYGFPLSTIPCLPYSSLLGTPSSFQYRRKPDSHTGSSPTRRKRSWAFNLPTGCVSLGKALSTAFALYFLGTCNASMRFLYADLALRLEKNLRPFPTTSTRPPGKRRTTRINNTPNTRTCICPMVRANASLMIA